VAKGTFRRPEAGESGASLLSVQKATLGTGREQLWKPVRPVVGFCLYVAKGTFRRPEAGKSGASFAMSKENVEVSKQCK
jgi:hypothetical protein